MATVVSAPTQQEKVREEVVRQLERLGGLTVRQDQVTFEGNRIVLPVNTTLMENANFLVKLAKEEAEETQVRRRFTYRPWDVAYCLSRVLKRVFGAMSHSGTWLSPPQFIEVPSGPGETVQVPQGVFQVPHLPDVSFHILQAQDDEWGVVGEMVAVGPKHRAAAINGVFVQLQEELENASLYRGKAIEYADMPKFMDTNRIDPSKIIYSREVQAALDTHINARLLYPEKLESLGVGFRAKILLEGEFGVGKTETLNLVAKLAQEQNVTFILVPKDRNADLLDAMQLAKMYEPSIVAFEDVDTVASAEQEVEHVSRVLDAFDGSQAKLSDVMVLITTNYVESLHAGMMRPGRIDAVIHIAPPDAEGIRRLIEVRIPSHVLDPDIDWEAVVKANDQYHPAFVVEGATLATRYAVVREAKEANGGEHVTTEDLVNAATELRRQFNLHRGARVKAEPKHLDAAVRTVVSSEVNRVLDEALDPRVLNEDR